MIDLYPTGARTVRVPEWWELWHQWLFCVHVLVLQSHCPLVHLQKTQVHVHLTSELRVTIIGQQWGRLHGFSILEQSNIRTIGRCPKTRDFCGRHMHIALSISHLPPCWECWVHWTSLPFGHLLSTHTPALIMSFECGRLLQVQEAFNSFAHSKMFWMKT